MSQDTSNPTNPRHPTTATLTHDPISHLHWLEFAGKPDAETRAALKAAGWRWGGYRKAWYNHRKRPTIPPCVEAEDGGEVQYAAERADRLEARAQKHDAAATAAYERSHAAVEQIPLGQPILAGHHSERMHRAALRRSHAAMDKSVREDATAKRLHQDAESSQRHQAHIETPEAMARRAERLEAEYRHMRRSIEDYEARLAREGRTMSDQDAENHRAYSQYAENTRRTAEQLRERITAAGGIAADRLDPQVGDIVQIAGFVGTILRVNPKTYRVHFNRPDWTATLERTKLTAIIQRAGSGATTNEQSA